MKRNDPLTPRFSLEVSSSDCAELSAVHSSLSTNSQSREELTEEKRRGCLSMNTDTDHIIQHHSIKIFIILLRVPSSSELWQRMFGPF